MPWLPPIPPALTADPQWGAYLTARADRVRTLAGAVTDLADQFTPTSAPGWAARLLDPAHAQLRRDLALWRAATGTPTTTPDPPARPTPPPPPRHTRPNWQGASPASSATPPRPRDMWTALADRLEPRLRHDEYWPQLADRLAALDRAGLNAAALLRSAAAERPLPDEHPAAALWWRITAHLSRQDVAPLPATSDMTHATPSGAAPSGAERTAQPTAGTVARHKPATEARWRELADSIDPRLSRDPDWPALAATLTALYDNGHDINESLPRLAAAPRPEHRPALELQYRLLAEARLPLPEPTTQPRPIPADDESSDPAPIQPVHDHNWGPSR